MKKLREYFAKQQIQRKGKTRTFFGNVSVILSLGNNTQVHSEAINIGTVKRASMYVYGDPPILHEALRQDTRRVEAPPTSSLDSAACDHTTFEVVILVTSNDGQRRYYANAREYEFTESRGSAARYESEADALYHAYELKAATIEVAAVLDDVLVIRRVHEVASCVRYVAPRPRPTQVGVGSV